MPAPAILLPRYQELSHCYRLCWVPQQLWQRLESVSADMALVGSLETQDLFGAPPSRYGVALLGLACLTFDCRCFSSNNLYTTFKIACTLHGFGNVWYIQHWTCFSIHFPPRPLTPTTILLLASCLFFDLPDVCFTMAAFWSLWITKRKGRRSKLLRRTRRPVLVLWCCAERVETQSAFTPTLVCRPFRPPQDMLLFAHVEPFSLQYVLIAYAVVSLADFPRAFHVMFTAPARLQLQFAPLTSPGNVSRIASHQPDAGNTPWTAIPGKVGDH